MLPDPRLVHALDKDAADYGARNGSLTAWTCGVVASRIEYLMWLRARMALTCLQYGTKRRCTFIQPEDA